MAQVSPGGATSEGEKRPRGRIRAAQREFTRSRLVEAAIEVFAQRGYARSTVDEIAERAGATRATFYLHFKGKSEILLDLMARGEEHFHRVYQDLGPVTSSPTLEGVREWLATAMREWDAVVDLARPTMEAAIIEPEVHEIQEKRDALQINELADALRLGAPDLSARDAEIYASILLAPLRHYFHLHIRGERFNKSRVLDVMAASWMAVISRAQLERKGPSRA
jgi:AcrR family transcriptional regulator